MAPTNTLIDLTGLSFGRWVVLYKLLKRCQDPRNKDFHNYGGRGITVCERWSGKDGFVNFLADMGKKPNAPSHTIERLENNKGYSPDNCVWATRTEQCNNKRDNRLITFNGETMTLAQWSRKNGIDHKVISYRLAAGWPVSLALATPPNRSTSTNRRKHYGA